MIILTTLLLLCLYVAPAHVVARPLAAAGNNLKHYVPFDETPSLAGDSSDITQATGRRNQVGAGPYTGITVQGPSGNLATGDGGGYGPGAFVNQGSSGTIVTGNAGTNIVCPVQLVFSGVPFGYRLPPSARDSIISFVIQVLQNNLDPAFQLIDVSYAGILPQNFWQNGWQNNNWQGVQNQNGQNAWNNQNAGPNNNWQGGQNQNGQTAWNNQNSGQNNNWQNGQNNGNGVNGSGAGVDWSNNGVSSNNNWNNNGGQSNNWNNNGGQNNWQNGGQNGAQGTGRGAISLSLRITVYGPSHIQSSGLTYTIQALLNNIQGLINYVRPLDVDAFTNLMMSVETYNFANLVDSTNEPTPRPTPFPTIRATDYPTRRPTQFPTRRPSNRPTPRPSQYPTPRPTPRPTEFPTPLPSNRPTPRPSRYPTPRPTPRPTKFPTPRPSNRPTPRPSPYPTPRPTPRPTKFPTPRPSNRPTPRPSPYPTPMPSLLPTLSPSIFPTLEPTLEPTPRPSPDPTPMSSNRRPPGPSPGSAPMPIDLSTLQPSKRPTAEPSQRPTPVPSTSEPTPMTEVEQTFPLQFNLDDIAPGYIPCDADQEYILGFIEDMIRDNLDPSLELADVSYGDHRRNRHLVSTKQMEICLYLPLEITLKGPPGAMDDAYPELLEVVEKNKQEVVEKLKDMDYDTFKDVNVSSEASDVIDVDSPTHLITHPVQFVFDNVAVGYELSERDQTSFILHVKKILKDNMDSDWEVIQVAYASRFELDVPTPQLPVRITVRGPAKESDRSLYFITDALEAREQDLAKYLNSLDRNAFEDVLVSVGSVDLPDVTAVTVPTFATDHSVQVIIKNVLPGYGFTTEIRTSIIRFIKELIKDNVNDSLELIDITYAGKFVSESATQSLSIPLSVTVRGPSEASDKTVLDVIEIIEDYVLDFMDFLNSLDQNAFEESTISAEPYDSDSIIEPITGIEKIVDIAETVHLAQLIFENASNGYRLSAADRASIIRFIKELMDDNLDGSLELVQVAYAGNANTDGPSLPLRITVKGPANESDFALAHVLDVLEDRKQDLEMLVKSLDWNEFKSVSLSMEIYDPASITETAGPEAEMVEMEETEHHVQVTLANVPAGYRLSAADRSSIIRIIKELVADNLHQTFELIEVASAGNTGRSLPLRIIVKGPTNQSDFALAYVMEVLEEIEKDLMMYLKSLEWNTFKDVNISIETYDPASVTETTEPEAEIVEMEETEHAVQLVFENVPVGHRLSAEDRANILRFVKELIEDNIDDQFQLVKVAYRGSEKIVDDNRGSLASLHKNNGRSLPSSRRLDNISLPLQITVKGPADVSDLALSYVMEVLTDSMQDLVRKVKSLDWDTFKNVLISTASHDPDSITEPSLEMVAMEETEHPVQLIFENVAPGYRLSAEDRASLIRFVKELLEDNLDESLELIEVAYADNRGNRGLLSHTQSLRPLQHTRRLDTLSLPLQITVKGPANESDFALSYVMDVLKDNAQDLMKYLKSLDWIAFKDVAISSELYDMASITTDPSSEMVEMEETEHPVQLTFNNISAGYRLSAGNRASIIRFVKELLEDNIDDSLELVKVIYAGSDGNRSLLSLSLQRTRKLNTLSLPLRITLRGPRDVSDFTLAFILDVLQAHEADIVDFLKSQGWNAFKDVNISSESYDMASITTDPSSGDAHMEETAHPVQLIFENISPDYRLSVEDRVSVIQFVKEGAKDSLDGALELIEVSYAGTGRLLQDGVYEQSLPLLVRVRAAADLSDLALVYIVRSIRDIIPDIELYLESLDGNIFTNVRVSVESYDLDDISDSTDPANNTIQSMDEEEDKTSWWVSYWWVWLLVVIGLLFLLCCLCICCGCITCRRYKKSKDESRKRDSDVLEKQTIVDRPVLYPPMQHHNTLVPYQPTFNPVMVQNSASLVPYANREVENQHQSRRLVLTPSRSFSTDSVSTFAFHGPTTYGDALSTTTSYMPQPQLLQTYADPNTHHAVQSYTTQSQSHLFEDPSTHGGGQSYATSIVPGHTNKNPNTFAVYRDFENQGHASQEPSGLYHWGEEQSLATQSAEVRLVVPGHEVQSYTTHTAQEPSGTYYWGEDQSYANQSTAVSLVVPGYTKKISRRQSGGVSSVDGSASYLYGRSMV